MAEQQVMDQVIVDAVVKAWAMPGNTHKPMDVTLVSAIVRNVQCAIRAGLAANQRPCADCPKTDPWSRAYDPAATDWVMGCHAARPERP